MTDFWSRWSAVKEARWLGLIPGWQGTPTFPRKSYVLYMRGLQLRRVDFSGTGLLTEEVRAAFLRALHAPELAPDILRSVIRFEDLSEPETDDGDADADDDRTVHGRQARKLGQYPRGRPPKLVSGGGRLLGAGQHALRGYKGK